MTDALTCLFLFLLLFLETSKLEVTKRSKRNGLIKSVLIFNCFDTLKPGPGRGLTSIIVGGKITNLLHDPLWYLKGTDEADITQTNEQEYIYSPPYRTCYNVKLKCGNLQTSTAVREKRPNSHA